MTGPSVGVVVVAYGAEPELGTCVESLLGSVGVQPRIVLVDNGCTRLDLDVLTSDPCITLVSGGGNLGFAAGCNVGASLLDEPYLAFVNSDAHVAPTALASLVAGLVDDVGLSTACILLASDPHRVNSAGNPVHYLGVSWAGGLGDPEALHEQARDVASASGAALALTRELWHSLGGFESSLFMYCEDMDLSLRVWQAGLRVRYVPDAKVWHHYNPAGGARKMYFLERNRLVVLLTVYATRTVLLLLPALVLTELALLLIAITEGRAKEKLTGYVWIMRNGRYLLERRRRIQQQRVRTDRELRWLFADRIDTPASPGGATLMANLVLPMYWRVARRLV